MFEEWGIMRLWMALYIIGNEVMDKVCPKADVIGGYKWKENSKFGRDTGEHGIDHENNTICSLD